MDFSDFPGDVGMEGAVEDEDMLNFFLASGIVEGLDSDPAVVGEHGRSRSGSGGVMADQLYVDRFRSDSFDDVVHHAEGGRARVMSGDLFSGIVPAQASSLVYPSSVDSSSPRGSDLRGSDLSMGIGIPLPEGIDSDLGLSGVDKLNAPGASSMKQSASSAMISSFNAASLSSSNEPPKRASKNTARQDSATISSTSSSSVSGEKGSKRGKKSGSGNSKAKGGSNASSRSSVKSLSTEEKKRRRLARNRESARQSRRRKKQYLELLEDKVEQLTQEVNSLRQKRLEQAPKELHQQWVASITELESTADRLREEGSDTLQETLKQNLSLIKKRFGPNSPEYLRILNHHFDLMQSVMLPPYTRFLLWVMDQGGDFFKTGSQRNRGKLKQTAQQQGAAGSGSAADLWPLVWNELGLTFEQEEKTKTMFASLNTEENIAARRQLAIGVNLLDRIHRVAFEHAKDMHALSEQLHNILTPLQQVRFFAWYDKNRKRIHECGLDRGLAGELSRIPTMISQKIETNDKDSLSKSGHLEAAKRIHSEFYHYSFVFVILAQL